MNIVFFWFFFFTRDRQVTIFFGADILTWKCYFVNEIKFQKNLVIVDVPRFATDVNYNHVGGYYYCFSLGSTILGVMYKDLHRMFATTSTEQDTPGISRFVSSTGGRGG